MIQEIKQSAQVFHQSINNQIPAIVNNLSGKPFWVWAICQAVATVLLWYGKVSELIWLGVVTIYFTGLSINNVVKKNNGTNN